MSDDINGSLDTSTLPAGCSCSACQSIGNGLENDTIITDDGGVYAPSITATPDQFANYLTNGFWADRGTIARKWDTSVDNEITFSIDSSYSASQKIGIRMAFDSWADVSDITFREISSNADIDLVTNASGQAFSSSSVYSDGTIASNYISIDTSQWYWSAFDQVGDYALITAIHEIGHSLGLGHTANYNGSGTYANDAQFVNDSRQYSVMSYFDASNTGANHLGKYASTPLIYDILAAQNLYGANMNARAGDTIYGFNSNAGDTQFDFSVNISPVVAIWDGNGIDTIDVSGWSNTQVINLNDGEFSNVGGGTGNLAIAINAQIENVVGGTGSDTIYGNEFANNINSSDANDTIYGSLGNDIIDGGRNTDHLIYTSYNLNDFTVSIIDSTTLSFLHNSLGFTDTITKVENYTFNGVSYTDAELRSALNFDYVQMTFKGEDGVWRYKMGNVLSGTLGFDSGDVGNGGATQYMSGTRNSNTTATISNIDNHVEIAYLSTTTLTNVTIQNFEYTEVYMRNALGVDLTVTNAQRGRIITGGGNDIIDVRLSLIDGTDDLSYRIESGAGNDTISVAITNASFNTLIMGGTGNDTINIAGTVDVESHGGDGDDVINGGNGGDRVYGGMGIDTIDGRGGNDIIYGDFGNDIINGGDGIDILLGGVGDDTIRGDAGNDRLYGDAGADTIYGGIGDDRLEGGDGDDHLEGDDGNDVIVGDIGMDTIYGGLGDDRLFGRDDSDTIYGEAGADIISGGLGNDIISGGDADDLLYGDAGDDNINGDLGNDYINGGDGNDTLNGGAGDDYIYGLYGMDTIYGGDGVDRLYGMDQNDTIYGGGDGDLIYGGDGNDLIYGDAGRDDLYGSAGNDTIHGGADADRVWAGSGDDILIGLSDYDALRGELGADTFATVQDNGGYDSYSDFRLTQNDKINVTDILTGYNHGVDNLNDFVFFDDRGSWQDMYVSQAGDGNFSRVARVYDGNTLDGQTVDDLVLSGNLIANLSVL